MACFGFALLCNSSTSLAACPNSFFFEPSLTISSSAADTSTSRSDLDALARSRVFEFREASILRIGDSGLDDVLVAISDSFVLRVRDNDVDDVLGVALFVPRIETSRGLPGLVASVAYPVTPDGGLTDIRAAEDATAFGTGDMAGDDVLLESVSILDKAVFLAGIADA